MGRPTVRALRPGEEAAAVDVLVDAFERDPLGRWLFPDRDTRRDAHHGLFAELISAHIPGATVDVTEPLDAAAIWLPPGCGPDLDTPPATAPAAAELFALLKASKPTGDFWYLAFLAARTPGTGAGSALLHHRLDTLEGTVALWTGNEANVGFYTRFGFAARSRCDVPGASAWWMTQKKTGADERT